MSKRRREPSGQGTTRGHREGKRRDARMPEQKQRRQNKNFWRRHPVFALTLPQALSFLAIVVAVFIVYHRVFNFFFAQDDFTSLWIAQQGPTTFWRIMASFVYFRVMEALFGLNPVYFHLLSLVFHAANGVLVFLVARAFSVGRVTAVLCAILFALHPSLYTSLYTISSIGEMLSTLFVLLAVLYMLRAKIPHTLAGTLTVSGLFAASLLSKETAIFFPLLVFLIYWLRGLNLKKALAPFGALTAVAAAYGYVFYTANVFGVKEAPVAGKPYAVSLGPELFSGIQTYLKWTFNVLESWQTHPMNVLDEKAGIWLAVGVAVFVLMLLPRGMKRRKNTYCVAWFAVTLAPVIPLTGHPYHYYLYMPLAGFVPAIGVFVSDRLRRTGLESAVSAALAVLFAFNSGGLVSKIENTTVSTSNRRTDPIFDRAMVAGNLIADLKEANLPQPSKLVLVSPLKAIREGRIKEHPYLVFVGGPYWDKNLRCAVAEGIGIRLFYPRVDTVVFTDELSPQFDGYVKALYTWDGHIRELHAPQP